MSVKDGYVWKLGEILVHQGWLKWEQLEDALEIQRKTGHLIGEIIVSKGYVGKKEGNILYLGEILISNGWVNWDALGKALFLQREDDRMLGDILLENNWVTLEHLYKALAVQHNMPFVQLEKFTIPPETIQLVPRHLALEHRILPLIRKDHILVIAISNPSHLVSQNDLHLAMDPTCKLHYALVCPDLLNLALRRYYPEAAAA